MYRARNFSWNSDKKSIHTIKQHRKKMSFHLQYFRNGSNYWHYFILLLTMIIDHSTMYLVDKCSDTKNQYSSDWKVHLRDIIRKIIGWEVVRLLDIMSVNNGWMKISSVIVIGCYRIGICEELDIQSRTGRTSYVNTIFCHYNLNFTTFVKSCIFHY